MDVGDRTFGVQGFDVFGTVVGQGVECLDFLEDVGGAQEASVGTGAAAGLQFCDDFLGEGGQWWRCGCGVRSGVGIGRGTGFVAHWIRGGGFVTVVWLRRGRSGFVGHDWRWR